MRDFSLFLDWRNDPHSKLVKTNWVTVYQNRSVEDGLAKERCIIFSALIPEPRLSEVRGTVDWDTQIGHGMPSLDQYENSNGLIEYEYYSFNVSFV